MLNRTAAILLMGILLASCSSTASPTGTASRVPTSAPSAVASPSAEAASMVPSTPAGSGPVAQFAAFKAHFVTSDDSLNSLFATLSNDMLANNASALPTDIAAIQAWSKAETDWLAANPLADCYGAAQSLWDNVRNNASKAAASASGGSDTYDQVTANFVFNSAKQVAALINVAHC